MATTKNGFNYEKILTDQDIIEQAMIVAEASKKIEEIKKQQKQIKELQKTIVMHSKYIQEGMIKEWTRGVFEWHKPYHGLVAVSFDEQYRNFGWTPFEPFFRVMTEEELKEHCELEIPSEQEEKEATEEQDTETVASFGFPYRIDYNESALAYVVSIVNEEFQREFVKSFLTYDEAFDFVTAKQREAEKEAKSAEEPSEVLARKIKSIAMEADDYGMIEIANEPDEDQEIGEIFGVTENKDEEPVISEEDPAPELKVVSDNEKYQIVENPDGSLKTILKTQDEEVKA